MFYFRHYIQRNLCKQALINGLGAKNNINTGSLFLINQAQWFKRVVPSYLLFMHRNQSIGFSTVSNNDIFTNAKKFEQNIAIIDNNGVFTYKNLLDSSILLAYILSRKFVEEKMLKNKIAIGPRVCFLFPNEVSYVIAQWAIWRLGGIAVPLYKNHPASLLEYYITDSRASIVMTSREFSPAVKDICQRLNVEHFQLDPIFYGKDKEGIEQSTSIGTTKFLEDYENLQKGIGQNIDVAAQILYSSGTTGKPKGVISTFKNMRAQIEALVKAWGWTSNDSILHVLPLHHLHGILNCLMCPLWVGATCIMLPEFNAEEVWQALQGETPKSLSHHGVEIPAKSRPNIFMAVPTIYSKLIQHYDKSCLEQIAKVRIHEEMKKIRLMVSGSSALPEPVMRKWKSITGHTLLERYGMTEIGMGLSNPLLGERRPGAVGTPLPEVEVQIAIAEDDDIEYRVAAKGTENGTEVTVGLEESEGELLVRGDNVFIEYWNKPEATKKSFTRDGWFKTGDTAVYKNGMYHILGRTSVDIIKRGGYKISALDIERQLLCHDAILDCAVVGVPDEVWGQIIAAVIVLDDGKLLGLEELKTWSSHYLAPYSIPTVLKILDCMPRNQMGKVNKKELLKDLFDVGVGTNK